MLVIGLTGGVASGKSTAAAVLRRHRLPVFDADAEVRRLQAPDGAALPAIAAAFPGTVARVGGRLVLDRAALRRAVLDAAGRPGLARLEALMHPLVRARERAFLASARRSRARAVVLDIPLLFEARGRDGIDIVVSMDVAPPLQRLRVHRRGSLNPAQLAAMLARQWPRERRRRHADVIVPSGLSRRHAQARLLRLLRRLGVA